MSENLFVRYVAENGEEWDNIDFRSRHTPVSGQFIHMGQKSYVVDEVWEIWEKHGAIEYGLTAFVSEVDVMDHRLGKFDPKYYGSH